jgi:hypothetical protein
MQIWDIEARKFRFVFKRPAGLRSAFSGRASLVTIGEQRVQFGAWRQAGGG